MGLERPGPRDCEIHHGIASGQSRRHEPTRQHDLRIVFSVPRLNRDTCFDGQHFQIDVYLLRPGNAAGRILSHRPRGAHRVKRVAKPKFDTAPVRSQ